MASVSSPGMSIAEATLIAWSCLGSASSYSWRRMFSGNTVSLTGMVSSHVSRLWKLARIRVRFTFLRSSQSGISSGFMRRYWMIAAVYLFTISGHLGCLPGAWAGY